MTNELDVIILNAIRAQNAGNCDQTFPLPRTSGPARLHSHRRHCATHSHIVFVNHIAESSGLHSDREMVQTGFNETYCLSDQK